MQANINKEEYKTLHQELKKYSDNKLILKNDSFFKYSLLNVNAFIHVSFWLWILWELWVIAAMLFPTNNAVLLNSPDGKVIFKSSFSYIYQIFNWNNNSVSTSTTQAYWFYESYIFVWLTVFILLINIYTFFLAKNCTLDIKSIATRINFSVLIRKITYFNTFWNMFMLFIVCFFSWIVFALVYVPHSSQTGNNVGNGQNSTATLLLQADTSKWFPLTIVGFLTFATNLIISGVIIKVYSKYCYEKYINNEFFFNESRPYTPIKEKKEAKKFNKKNNKSKLFSWKSAHFLVSNTPGYISELTNINKIYYINNQPFYALKDINLKIKVGEFIVILGPSGSGKTTLVNILSGIDKPTNGKIILNNCDTMKMTDHQLNLFRRKNIGYVFQHYALLCNLTAKENIEIVSHLNKDNSLKKLFKNVSSEKDAKTRNLIIRKWFKDAFMAGNSSEVDKLLEILNLTEQSHKYPHQLSGGQQQRVAIARALIKKPKILFGDETTGALDSDTARKILELFYLINKHSKTTVIMITHNPAIADIADRVLYVSQGQIVNDVTNEKPKKISELKNL